MATTKRVRHRASQAEEVGEGFGESTGVDGRDYGVRCRPGLGIPVATIMCGQVQRFGLGEQRSWGASGSGSR